MKNIFQDNIRVFVKSDSQNRREEYNLMQTANNEGLLKHAGIRAMYDATHASVNTAIVS